MKSIEEKYAELLTSYCLELKEGDKFYLKSTTLAEPLVREVYKYAIEAGAIVEVDLDFAEKNNIFLHTAKEHQLRYVSPLYYNAMDKFDAYLLIRAPFNLKEDASVPTEATKIRSEALAAANKRYFTRIADRSLKRSLCQYPTQASAQEADMSLTEYSDFVYRACKLHLDSPEEGWLKVRAEQQRIVDHLNHCQRVHYKGPDTDIRFSTKGRTWINSDGRSNMPSGEVFTSPVENSVEGTIRFSFPAIHGGHEVEQATLWVKKGIIYKWEASKGKDYLDKIFNIPGTTRFGEAAIGTNYEIQKITKNILFDEKIGGSIHMAIGQSYLQCGGKNKSSVHWDMISDMKQGGEIWADDELIYKDGQFLI